MGRSWEDYRGQVQEQGTRLTALIEELQRIACDIEEAREFATQAAQRDEEARVLLSRFGLDKELDDKGQAPGFDAGAAQSELTDMCRHVTTAVTGLADMLEDLRDSVSQSIARLHEDAASHQTLIDDLTARHQRLVEEEEEAERRRREEEAAASTFHHENTVSFEDAGNLEEALAGTERRRFSRDNCTLAVRLEGTSRLLSANAQNISPGGVFLNVDEDVDLGAMVHVACTLRDGHVVHADGVVSWKRDAGPEGLGVGVEFVALTDDDRSRLENSKP